jgi:sugar phosphate isomerase/epimerase
MHTPAAWARFDDLLCIENMDKRKPVGQTAADLARIFEALPRASFCFDIGHARQVDPTMSEATAILQSFSQRLKQLHVSDVNTKSKHDPLSLESMMAFQRVSHLVPPEIPIIMESRVDEAHICEELERAVESLTPNAVLAIAGD